jgi:hypothetical protein
MTTAEKNKIDILAERIDQYCKQAEPELDYYIQQHSYYLTLIDQTGFNDPEQDLVLLGPATLGRIEIWYSMARKEAISIAGKCRELQKFYLANAEQAKSNQYERVRLGDYDSKMSSATDAKEIARRVGGRLEEKAARYEGDYLRWQGIADSYEQMGNAVKDSFKLAEYEFHLLKSR